MSVRVCYVERAERGTTVRSLRLVGLAQDEQWSAQSSGNDADAGAAWIKQLLSGTRDSSSLTLMCLDVDGGVCSWLTSPSANPAVVAALARQGGGEALARAGSPVEFYAADSFSSSIQPLDGRAAANGSARRPRKSAIPPEPQRLAVMGITDVPARLLMDALDREGIPVESVASLWHVMAAAWDPARRAAVSEEEKALQGETASLTGVILIDPSASRLIWSWSKGGSLVVAGSMRLRQAQAEPDALAQPGDAPAPTLQYGEAEVSRLANEWLSWAAQLGRAPARFVCVLPDTAHAGEFGRALGKAWPGATVDVVTNADPVGATLKRTASVLENTPSNTADPDPRAGLIDLSRRPGAQHRRMYVWWSGAVAAAALVLIVLGIQLRGAAERAQAAAAQWRQQGADAIAEVAPDIKDAPGKSRMQGFQDEVKRLETRIAPAARNDEAMPVMEELETISLVVGNAGYAIESISLDSKGLPRFTVVANNTKDAEDLLEALKRVSGSYVTEWAGNYVPRKVDGEDKVAATFSGRWNPPKPGGPR